jgi:hypothetical protein
LSLVIHDEAELELEQAHDYYEKGREGLGAEFIYEFRRGVDRIIENPKSWAQLDRVYRRYRLHRFPYGVVYRQPMDDQVVIDQLVYFYSIVDGVPCLDSLDIHRCADLILFEWWDQQELWLGQKDFQTFRWSASKQRFCIGSAGNVSFSEDDEYSTFAEALGHLVERDHASG